MTVDSSLLSLDNTPADCVPGALAYRSNQQFHLCRIDQKMDVGGVLKLADTGIIEGDACPTDGHSGIKLMGNKFPPDHLVPFETEAGLQGQALGLQLFFPA